MESRPLVSVIVVSYNSSSYILETLESVRKQTYPDIELIVADDASTDDTLDIIRRWLSLHGAEFAGYRVVASERNGGLASNCNNGLKNAKGVWIKLIAGDDILLENCIADNVGYVCGNPGVTVVFSRMSRIDESGDFLNEYFFPWAFFSYPPLKQLQYLLYRNCLPAPSSFIKREPLELAGGFDPDYPMMEDLPLWVRLLDAGHLFGGMDKITVHYRIHKNSVQVKKEKGKSRYLQNRESFDRVVRLPMSRNLSLLLFVSIKIDIGMDRIVRKPVLLKAFYPVFWAWARFSPFTLSRSRRFLPN